MSRKVFFPSMKRIAVYPLFIFCFVSCKTISTYELGSVDSAIHTQQIFNDDTIIFKHASVHPSGKFLFIAGIDQASQKWIIKVWDTRWPPPKNKSLVHTFGLSHSINLKGPAGNAQKFSQYISIAPSGDLFAIADKSGLYVGTFNENGSHSEPKMVYQGPRMHVAFSPDGQFLANASRVNSSHPWVVYFDTKTLRQFAKTGSKEGLKVESVYRPESIRAEINSLSWHMETLSGKNGRYQRDVKVLSLLITDSESGLHAYLVEGEKPKLFSYNSSRQFTSMDYHLHHYKIGNNRYLLKTPELKTAEIVNYSPVTMRFERYSYAGRGAFGEATSNYNPRFETRYGKGLESEGEFPMQIQSQSLLGGGSQVAPKLFSPYESSMMIYAPVAHGLIYGFSIKEHPNADEKKGEPKYEINLSERILCLPLEGDAFYISPQLTHDQTLEQCNGQRKLDVYWMGTNPQDSKVLYIITEFGRVYEINTSKYRSL